MRSSWGAVLAAVVLTGCDQNRVDALEKENRELRRQLDESKRLSLDTQEKCSTAAQRFFQREFSANKETMLLHQTNHYNSKLGKCFVLVEWHYSDEGNKTSSWQNVVMLFDAYENHKYGDFSEYHSLGADFKPTTSLYGCSVDGQKCTSIEDFARATNGYMSE